MILIQLYLISIIFYCLSIMCLKHKINTDSSIIDKLVILNKYTESSREGISTVIFTGLTPLVNILFGFIILGFILISVEKLESLIDSMEE